MARGGLSSDDGREGANGYIAPSVEACQDEAFAHLREAVSKGGHWFPALLGAMALWTAPEELHEGRHYRYLIGGEAFDWLLLAERLLAGLGDDRSLVPEEERIELLFLGLPPVAMTSEQFRDLIGVAKYRAHLNHWYGMVVEEALQAAVMDEVVKSRQGLAADEVKLEDEALRRLYNADHDELFAEFRQQREPPQEAGSSSLAEQREFTYWLFKKRLRLHDPARVASDTRKALLKLHQIRPASFLDPDIDSEPLAISVQGAWRQGGP